MGRVRGWRIRGQRVRGWNGRSQRSGSRGAALSKDCQAAESGGVERPISAGPQQGSAPQRRESGGEIEPWARTSDGEMPNRSRKQALK